MTVGNNTLYFTSDTVTYNGTTYYYAKNLQGDIVAILNSSGTAVVQYTYDAWGKLLSTTGSMASTLGLHNPLRYRGYVYDTETGLYYLQSRYYNPEIGRFINADTLVATGQGPLGNNMFAYCLNNPVINYDPYGFWTDGQIHDEVIEEIVKRSGNRYKHKRHDTLIVYEVAWGLKWFGFCDLYDPQTGEVWELKKNTASTSCATPRALAQLQNYVNNGHLLSDISLQLKVGEAYVRGGFFTRTDPSGTQYFISYWDQGGGILRYDYVAIPSEFDVLASATVGYALYVSITIQDSGKHNVHNGYYE